MKVDEQGEQDRLGDIVAGLVERTILLCGNNPTLEFAALVQAAAFPAVSAYTEDEAVECLRHSYRMAERARRGRRGVQ